jgi:hypothetical protein
MKGKKARLKKNPTASYTAPLPFLSDAVAAREYIYSFEVTHPYPSVRSFIFKKPLTKSMADSFMELFGGGKKRPAL